MNYVQGGDLAKHSAQIGYDKDIAHPLAKLHVP